MFCAAITVVALIAALLLVLFTQSAKPAPLTVEIMAPGEPENRLVCGVYATANEDGITVTKPDKATETTPWAEVGKVNAVRSC